MKTRWQTASVGAQDANCTLSSLGATAHIDCTGGASNPLILLAPPTGYDLHITLALETTQIRYVITGCHKFFPAYEILVNDRIILGDLDSGFPASLVLPCSLSAQILVTGVVPR
jgi:hypothetical protein